jgi:integrase
MPTVKLTDAAVQRLKAPAGGRVDYFDATLPGFGLRVSGPTPTTPEGRRTWTLFYRHGGKQRRLSLDPPYPALGLAEARKKAGDALARLAEGKDPADDKAQAKAAAARAPDTVANVVDLFIRRGLEAKKRAPRYVTETRRNFDLHVLPRWGERDIKTITRRDVIDLLDAIADGGSKVKGPDGKRRKIAGGPIAANRVLAAIKAAFNFAIRRGILDASPVALVERPGAETKRDRALSDDEIRALWPLMGSLGYPGGPFFRLALATGQRRNEVAGMRWADLDLVARTWTLPAGMTKARREHFVPLSPLAVAILSDLPKLGPFVFAGAARRSRKRDAGDRRSGEPCPISGFAKLKGRLDKKGKDAEARVAPWTIHDLRRTAATGMARLAVSRFVIGKVLNHSDRSVTGIYDRHAYMAEKRAALDAWSECLESLTRPAPDNVVALRRAAQ